MRSSDVTVAEMNLVNESNTNDKPVQQQTFRPPVYSPPYPVRFNPNFFSGIVSEKAHQWLQDHKVDTALSPGLYKVLVDMDVSGLPGRIYTEAGEWGLEWACKHFFMLWIWDDTFDSTAVGQSPETALLPLLEAHLMMLWSFPDDSVLLKRLNPFLTHLKGQDREEKTKYIESVLAEARTKPGTVYSLPTSNVICSIYLDLWTDAITKASPEFCLRLAHANQLWLLGCLREIENRKDKTIPVSIDDYIKIRKGSSAVPGTVVIVDIVYGLSTPDSWFQSPEMQRVLQATNDIVSWHNDLWSFKREVLVEKDLFNMVLAISVHQKVSYTEAAQITTNMIYARIADLEQAATDLDAITSPEQRQSYERYMLTCRNWVSGTHDWHSTSMRYQ